LIEVKDVVVAVAAVDEGAAGPGDYQPEDWKYFLDAKHKVITYNICFKSQEIKTRLTVSKLHTYQKARPL
jgi:hypothetical protein